ncbi:MAG: PEP-CTERM sorting domain-containing protein [Limisphaerales bacterium]
MKTALITPSLALAAGLAAQAQLSLTQPGVPATVNFEETVAGVGNGAFAGTGFTPTPAAGQLDSDAWAVLGLSDGAVNFGGTVTSGDAARGATSSPVTQGGVYAFSGGSISGQALGFQPGGSDFDGGGTGGLYFRMVNNTGVTLDLLSVSYTGHYRNDQTRASTVTFAWSPDNVTYTAVSSLGFSTPADAVTGAQFVSAPRSGDVGGLSIAPGEPFYFRWQHTSTGTGSRDELALDDLVITAVPEPGALTLLGLGAGLLALRRRP